jgi:hypothetical protein
MPEFDQFEPALEKAGRKVAESYRDAPSKQDLICAYDLTEDDIDGIKEELKVRLSRLGNIALEIPGVYEEHLHQALQGKKRQPRPEVLLEDVQTRTEERAATKLARELFKEAPNESAETVLAYMHDRPHPAKQLAQEEVQQLAQQPPQQPTRPRRPR